MHSSYSLLAAILLDLKEYKEAIKYINLNSIYFKKQNDLNALSYDLNTLAQIYYEQKKYSLSVKSDGGVVNVILRAALTNNPNLTQLEAIAAMEADPMNPLLQKLKDLLGLPPEATEDDVLASIKPPAELAAKPAKPTKAGTATAPDPTNWVAMAAFERVVAELNRLNQGVEKQSAETHVEDHIRGGRLPPYLRNWGIELCMANKPQFDQFVDRTKRLYEPLFKVALSGLPQSDVQSQLTVHEQDAAHRMNLTPEEFVRGKRG